MVVWSIHNLDMTELQTALEARLLPSSRIQIPSIYVGTRKHQKIRIDGFSCLIRVFPGDLSIVQGFCEV